jgi:hypothetical protein
MYKLKTDWENQVNGVINLENGYVIPMNPDNTDYQAYLKWVAEGGVPTPADE